MSDTSPKPIHPYVRRARELDRGSFLDRFRDAVFVVEPFELSDDTGFETMGAAGGSGPLIATSVVVVRKRAGANAFGSMITIGRATNNDLQLSADEISKFHAYVKPGADGAHILVDANSSYGTWVADSKLPPKGEAPLTPGTKVRFGRLEATYHSPRSFYESLLAFPKAP